jgi:hypothetical protein
LKAVNLFGAEIGAVLVLELGTAKNKMNISVPTGNWRLWQEEDIIAFVGPSLLTVSATYTVDDRELCMVLDIKLGFKIGTVLDRGPSTVVVHNVKLGSKLGLVVDRKLGSKMWMVLNGGPST